MSPLLEVPGTNLSLAPLLLGSLRRLQSDVQYREPDLGSESMYSVMCEFIQYDSLLFTYLVVCRFKCGAEMLHHALKFLPHTISVKKYIDVIFWQHEIFPNLRRIGSAPSENMKPRHTGEFRFIRTNSVSVRQDHIILSPTHIE